MSRQKLIEITGKAISGEWGNDSDYGSGFPVLRTTNFTNDGKINYVNVAIRNIKKINLSTKFLQPGDVIVEKSGGSDKQPVGRVVYYDGPVNTYLFNNFTGVLRVINKNNWLPKYLFYALHSNYLRGGTRAYENKTTGLHNLKMDSFINNFSLPEICIEKQYAIVASLDRISSLISLRKQQLEKSDQFVKSKFIEMFGDPVANPNNWNIKPLSQLGELSRGVSKTRPRNKPELMNGPYPLVQTGEISNAGLYITSAKSSYSEAGLAQSKLWPKGTLCITIAANIAQTGILTFNACFPDSVVGFNSGEKYTQIYMHYWFDFFQKILEEQASQVAQKNINLKILSELQVMIPPIKYQQLFFDFVQQLEQSKVDFNKSIDKLKTLEKSLMQEYFG